MGKHSDLRFLGLLETIQSYFAFLLRRGFQITSVIFIDEEYEDWQITLETDKCILKIYRNTGKVDLALIIPQLYDTVGLLELGDLISGIDRDENLLVPKQNYPIHEAPDLLRIAHLLEKYIDDILEKIGGMLAYLSIDRSPAPSSTPYQKFQNN